MVSLFASPTGNSCSPSPLTLQPSGKGCSTTQLAHQHRPLLAQGLVAAAAADAAAAASAAAADGALHVGPMPCSAMPVGSYNNSRCCSSARPPGRRPWLSVGNIRFIGSLTRFCTSLRLPGRFWLPLVGALAAYIQQAGFLCVH